MKKVLIIIVLISSCWSVFAQQDLMVSQYMFNHAFVNPAAIAVKGGYNASLMYRKQWVQFEGAPESQFLSVDGPVISDKMGLGLLLQTDKIGVNRQTDLMAGYSYIIDMDEIKLSFGLRAGMSVFQANYSEHKAWDTSDDLLRQNVSSYLPNFGFGSYIKHEKYFAGISIPHILNFDPNSSLKVDIKNSNQAVRHYYLMGGYNLTLNDNFVLQPSMLLKHSERAPTQLDLNALVEFKQKYSLGIGYRTGDSFILLTKIEIMEKFQFGYSFDVTLTDIRDYSKGSHEIMLNYSFGNTSKASLPSFN